MLCGLVITICWLPGQECQNGTVKSLEEWEVGRESRTFARTGFAQAIAAAYHRAAKTWDKIYLWLDKISGGDEAERRLASEMDEMVEAN